MKNKRKGALRVATCLLAVLALTFSTVGSVYAVDSSDLQTVTPDENALYNGIVVPDNWNYTISPLQASVIEVPYLKTAAQGGYMPDIINIDVGRQLFVDDFLIDSTTLTTTYYQAEIMEEPLFTESTKYSETAVLTSGGVWYDMDEDIYKMWYQAGFVGKSAYATSTDGINWERAKISSNGTNIVLSSVNNIASSTVWIY